MATPRVAEKPSRWSGGRAELRVRLQRMRDELGIEKRARDSQRACELIASSLEDLLRGRPRNLRGEGPGNRTPTVALYRAMGSELNLEKLAALLPDVRFAAPVTLAHGRMEFVLVDIRELQAGYSAGLLPRFLACPWKPLETVPSDRVLVEAGRLDLVLVPGLGFDEDGNRLGYGGGYYDRYLARIDLRAPRWGVAFAEQLVPRGTLQSEPHDVAVDALVTPAGLIQMPSRRSL